MLCSVHKCNHSVREDRIQHSIHFICKYNLILIYHTENVYRPCKELSHTCGVHLQLSSEKIAIFVVADNDCLTVWFFLIKLDTTDTIVYHPEDFQISLIFKNTHIGILLDYIICHIKCQ